MLRIRFLKSLDWWLGSALVRVLPRPLPLPCATIAARTILLIRPGGIGDAVHLVPTIQVLRERFPDIAVDILAERRNAGIFALCPGIRQVFHYDRPGQLLRALRSHYDVVIDTEQWHRLSAVVARLVKAPVKVGFATNERQGMLSHTVPYSHDDYERDSFLHLLAPLGIADAAAPENMWLQVPEAARGTATLLLAEGASRPFVAIFPGASVVERRWGAERFRSVAQWCLAQGLHVVVVGGGGDRDEGACIADGLDGVVNLAGWTSLAETAAVLERAAVVVSGDSGILHIAVGLGRPTVSLFGPGIAAKWAPRGARHVVLNKNLSCSPCTRYGYTPACSHEIRCMREITVEDVAAGISAVIHELKPGRSPC